MAQLQRFLFELSFGQTRRIREYMPKRYGVYCGSMKDLEQAINDYIPNEDILEELRYWHDRRVLRGRMAERKRHQWLNSTGRNNKFNKRITGEYDKELLQE